MIKNDLQMCTFQKELDSTGDSNKTVIKGGASDGLANLLYIDRKLSDIFAPTQTHLLSFNQTYCSVELLQPFFVTITLQAIIGFGIN